MPASFSVPLHLLPMQGLSAISSRRYFSTGSSLMDFRGTLATMATSDAEEDSEDFEVAADADVELTDNDLALIRDFDETLVPIVLQRDARSDLQQTDQSELAEEPFSRGLRDQQSSDLANATFRPFPVQQKSHIPNPSGSTRVEQLTHVNEHGEAHMVDVGHKTVTKRVAIACSTVVFSSSKAPTAIRLNTLVKGDVFAVARIAGIMAAKKTSELIPLCHPLALTKVSVTMSLAQAEGASFQHVNIEAEVHCNGETGVEMEALTAANVAALTVYDMCKAVDKHMTIKDTFLRYKSGGKSGGVYQRDSVKVKGTETRSQDRGM